MLPHHDPPSTQALLGWLRNRLPDLRVVHAVVPSEDGSEATRKLVVLEFTFRGETHQEGGESGDAVVLSVANKLRGVYGLAPLGAPNPREQIERDILLARMGGDDARADILERELVTCNAQRRRLPSAPTRTRFHQ